MTTAQWIVLGIAVFFGVLAGLCALSAAGDAGSAMPIGSILFWPLAVIAAACGVAWALMFL